MSDIAAGAIILDRRANLVSGLPISSGDRTAIAGYASTYHVPGIS